MHHKIELLASTEYICFTAKVKCQKIVDETNFSWPVDFFFSLSLRGSYQHFSKELREYTYFFLHWRHSLIEWTSKNSSLNSEIHSFFCSREYFFSYLLYSMNTWILRKLEMSMPLLILYVSPHVLDLGFFYLGHKEMTACTQERKRIMNLIQYPILYKGEKKCTQQIKMKYARIPWKWCVRSLCMN